MGRNRSLSTLALCVSLTACYTPTVNPTRTYHPSDADLTITRIVHASAIVDFRETRILLDPWYSPTPPLGPAETIAIRLDNLPSLRGILITHKHDDHFDSESLRNYPDKSVRVVVPKGLGATLKSMGYDDVVELGEWERSQIGSVIVTAVPARHRVPENGYVLQANGVTLYVAGDTRFDQAMFEQIASFFPAIDAALLPIGGIRILFRRLDMSPEQAADAFEILHPKHVIPYHYGLRGPFPFFMSAADPTKSFLEALLAEDEQARDAVVVLETGQSWHHYR